MCTRFGKIRKWDGIQPTTTTSKCSTYCLTSFGSRMLCYTTGIINFSHKNIKMRFKNTQLVSFDAIEIVFDFSADSDIYQHAKTNSLVYNNGTVLWVPPTKYEANCKLDMRLWPFDRQSCKVVVGSWTHHVGQINLQLENDWKEDYMTENDEWYLVKMDSERNSRKYACCVEEYADITYTLILQRRPETYKTLILSPALGENHTCIPAKSGSDCWLVKFWMALLKKGIVLWKFRKILVFNI